jgi:hypothetical protein
MEEREVENEAVRLPLQVPALRGGELAGEEAVPPRRRADPAVGVERVERAERGRELDDRLRAAILVPHEEDGALRASVELGDALHARPLDVALGMARRERQLAFAGQVLDLARQGRRRLVELARPELRQRRRVIGVVGVEQLGDASLAGGALTHLGA